MLSLNDLVKNGLVGLIFKKREDIIKIVFRICILGKKCIHCTILKFMSVSVFFFLK